MLDAQPSKRILLNQARGITPDIAFSEIIDNAIDVWRDPSRKREAPRDLNVRVQFEFSGDRCTRITIRDDGGGVEAERLTALVKAGIENPNPWAIGVWGQGLKVGCIALAEDAQFLTRPPEGRAYRIDWPKEWWESPDWKFWANPVPDDQVAPGTMTIILTNLKTPLRRDEIAGDPNGDSLLSRLGRIYAPLLSTSESTKLNLVAVVDDVEIPLHSHSFGDPARWTEVFAFPPGYPPTIHHRKFGSKGLTARFVVGLLPEQSRDYSGVTMYGKGRLFVQGLKEGAVGFGTRGAAMIPASHPTTWRLLVFAYFEGPSTEIPWSPVTKREYAANNPYNKDIRAFIASIAAPYAAFTKVAKRLDILPYSKMWNEMAREEVEKEVAAYARDTMPVSDFLAQSPHLTAKFEVPAKVPEARSLATATVPAINAPVSRAVALGLQQRNNEPRESRSPARLWTPQVLAAREAQPAANRRAPRTAEAPSEEVPPELMLSTQADADWNENRVLTIRLPRAVVACIEEGAGSSPVSYVTEAALRRAAGELDALVGVRTESFRPILQVLRHRILDMFPAVQRIGLFGSVAKGTADRESDIDLLLVHPDPLVTQRKANQAFQDFRHPAIHGPRYKISTQVVDDAGLIRLQQAKGGKDAELVSTLVWLHPKPPAVA